MSKNTSRMMSAFCCSFLLAFGVTIAAEPSSETPQVNAPFLGGFLKETRIIYPLRIEEWTAQGEHLYEQQEYGVSIRYKSDKYDDRWIDVYAYPVGVLTTNEFATIAEQTAQEPRLAAEARGEVRDFEIDKLSEFTIRVPPTLEKGKPEVLEARSVSMRMPREGEVYNSAMVITAHRLYLIKGRYSVERGKASDSAVKRTLERFLRDIVRSTTIVSTGGCWMPIPIVQKPAPLVSADNALVSVRTQEQGFAAVAYADRIEALNASSPEAVLMQFVAMSATGRAVAGCVPQEDINPEVPDGMREIRIEYRPPSGDTPNQRKSRSAVNIDRS